MAKSSISASVAPAAVAAATSAPAYAPNTAAAADNRQNTRQQPAPPSSWYAARAILDETATHYLIDWDGIDPATGARFTSTWEPRRNANATLRRAWAKLRKQDKRGDGEQPAPPSSWYVARAILDETATRYLIDWDGVDPATGARFAPTWEPKRNANATLRRAWAKRKKQNKNGDDGADAAGHPAAMLEKTGTRNARSLAEGKRKRDLHDEGPNTGSSNNKRQRQNDGGTGETYYPAKAIVGERRRHFRVAWETDATTGQEFEDTWEPKAYVSHDLVDSWRRRKQQARQHKQQAKRQGIAKQHHGREKEQRPGTLVVEPTTPLRDDDDEGEEEEGEEISPPCNTNPTVPADQSHVQDNAMRETTPAAADRRASDTQPDTAANALPQAAQTDKAKAVSNLENASPFWSPTQSRPKLVTLYGSKIKRPLMNLW